MRCEYHLAVIDAFGAMCEALSAAEACIEADNHLPGWMQPLEAPPLRHDNIRKQSINLLNQLEYLEGQEGREILLGVGIFAASQKTIDHLHQLNQCKSQFKYAVQNLKCQAIDTDEEALFHAFQALLSQTRHSETEQTLTRSGLSRLHLKQCYRQIPILDARPLKVSWVWANTRSIKRISKTQAIALLNKKGDDPGIQAQIAKVAALPDKAEIAIVQTLAPHLRTNIVMSAGENTARHMLKGSLPLFYVHEDGSDLPEIVAPKAVRKQENRPTRSDVKIDPEVFLPAIRGHLYFSVN
ncbi:MAG: DNA replication terminus site-binding family protein [Gammaproteobacteria bacterium]